MHKRIFYLIICLTSLFIEATSTKAQNNAFKINDSLYEYYRKCIKVVSEDKVLLMSDTLFEMSKQLNDKKAECIAIYIKGNHYYTKRNIPALLKTRDQLYQFTRLLPYKQYYFGLWNLYLAYLTRQNKFSEAIKEAEKYRERAYQLNNDYAIGFSYEKIADLYFVQGHFEQSADNYRQAYEYFKSKGINGELNLCTNSIGACYYSMGNYVEALKYYDITMSNHTSTTYYDRAIMLQCTIYSILGNEEKAEHFMQLLLKWKKENPSTSKMETSECIMWVLYYGMKKEYKKAASYCDLLNKELNITQFKHLPLYMQGKYEEAYNTYVRYCELSDIDKQELTMQEIEKFSTIMDNDKLTAERNALLLKNSEIELSQLRNKQHILTLKRSKNKLELTNTDLELNYKNLSLLRQHAEIVKEKAEIDKKNAEVTSQREKNKSLQLINKQNDRIILLISLTIFCIIIAAIVFVFVHWINVKQLKIEMKNTEEERKRAVEAREKAEKTDRLKAIFMQNISYEIRKPLDSIINFAGLLTNSNQKTAIKSKGFYVQSINDNTVQLTNLVDNVLALSQMNSGNYSLTYSKSDLDKLGERVLESTSNLKSKNVELIFNKPIYNIQLYTDAILLHKVLYNLIADACFRTETGRIQLTYTMINHQVSFSVSDTGSKISYTNEFLNAKHLDDIIDKENNGNLSIVLCMHIVKLLHGSMSIGETSDGKNQIIFNHPLTDEGTTLTDDTQKKMI